MRINRKNALKYSAAFLTKNASNSMQNRSEPALKEISEIVQELEQAKLEILAETQVELDKIAVQELQSKTDTES